MSNKNDRILKALLIEVGTRVLALTLPVGILAAAAVLVHAINDADSEVWKEQPSDPCRSNGGDRGHLAPGDPSAGTAVRGP